MNVRMITAGAVLVTGAVHLWLWFDGMRELTVVGPSFLLNAASALVIAVLLLRWTHPLPLLLAVGLGASTLGAFVIASTVGLFGVHEHWTGSYVWIAAAAEVVAVAAGLTGLLREQRGSAVEPHHRFSVRVPHLH